MSLPWCCFQVRLGIPNRVAFGVHLGCLAVILFGVGPEGHVASLFPDRSQLFPGA